MISSVVLLRVRNLERRFDFSALSVLPAYVMPDIGYNTHGKEQCLASPLLVFIASQRIRFLHSVYINFVNN